MRLYLYLCPALQAWIYMHNPPGSNNRLNEQSAQNANSARLFTSNNNRRGGYNVPDSGATKAESSREQFMLTYFAGSTLLVEWAQLHGCDENGDGQRCRVTIEVSSKFGKAHHATFKGMCGEHLQNGITSDTSVYGGDELDSTEDYRRQMNTDLMASKECGRHETWLDYHACRFGKKQTKKRKFDENDKRHGYECNHERLDKDHPASPFFPIVELAADCSTAQTKRDWRHVCQTRQSNDKATFALHHADETSCAGDWLVVYSALHASDAKQTDCTGPNQVFGYELTEDDIRMGRALVKKCLQRAPTPRLCSRPFNTKRGALSNFDDGEYPRFEWRIPQVTRETKCVLRLRYFVESVVTRNRDDEKVRFYAALDQPLSEQLPRRLDVYQDRSHVFILAPRPAEIGVNRRLINVNVRGKRGNIVQTYPAVEYDFVPNQLALHVGDAIHLQWSGSNTHHNDQPGGDGQTGDAGQGQSGTDRSNFLQLAQLDQNYPIPFEHASLWRNVEWLWSSVSDVDMNDMRNLAVYYAYSGYYECYKKCKRAYDKLELVDAKLNTAPASVRGHVFAFTAANSTFHFISTRFSNLLVK